MISGRIPLEKFVHRALRNDGVFILRIIATNAGDLITTDIVAALWKMYLEEEKKRAIAPPSLAGTAPKLEDEQPDGFQEDLFHDDRQPLT